MSGTSDDLFDGHYQTEYKGAVGFEKKFHKDHFPVTEIKIRNTEFDSGYRWVKTGPGRYIRVRNKNGKEMQTEEGT